MSRRPPRRGRRSQATNRGQAASVSQSTLLVMDMVHPLQVAVGHACPFFLLLAVLLSHNMQKSWWSG
ncbi:hypothetical protein AB205_0060090 [Aquarana catesbeiana]|uniref:Uncharacterized protein n=1 Tax=Aquarana catesbeiana TaxID=8400 RepID=A0A2G9SFG7_AQUCT|nr:hypothetical protein AB205_0060090 [Aquarana catesbeiana]